MLGIQCGIYRRSYNTSNISYVNSPPPSFFFIPLPPTYQLFLKSFFLMEAQVFFPHTRCGRYSVISFNFFTVQECCRDLQFLPMKCYSDALDSESDQCIQQNVPCQVIPPWSWYPRWSNSGQGTDCPISFISRVLYYLLHADCIVGVFYTLACDGPHSLSCILSAPGTIVNPLLLISASCTLSRRLWNAPLSL